MGCLLSKDKWSDIADGVMLCCHDPSLNSSGVFPSFNWGNASTYTWAHNAGKTTYATVGGAGGISIDPLLCSVAVPKKAEIAASMLASALANNLTGSVAQTRCINMSITSREVACQHLWKLEDTASGLTFMLTCAIPILVSIHQF